jgi:hypothetical protein
VFLVLVVTLTGVFTWWRRLFGRGRCGFRGRRIVASGVAIPATATSTPVAACFAAVRVVRVHAIAVVAVFRVVGALLLISGLGFAWLPAGLFGLAASYIAGVFAACPTGLRTDASCGLFVVRMGLRLLTGTVTAVV